MDLLKIATVAEICNCSARHIRRLVNNGEIASVSLGPSPKSDRIERSELERYVERNRTTRTKPCRHSNFATKRTTSASAQAVKSLNELLATKSQRKQGLENMKSYFSPK